MLTVIGVGTLITMWGLYPYSNIPP
ncbi:hypothetical protein CGLO_01552 [Colletotrichum gloeosporioides Cg-14]|uniref:Uncharacterized protein n=1 Tax=Colletotrichum gloeosporioides (strain Cg-14) TaxID=1237896 RepID=T0MB60_COLGC|nr:hypothetical protein CGLO_01552 [Colletotrichum gloeosporioides Cg-14]